MSPIHSGRLLLGVSHMFWHRNMQASFKTETVSLKRDWPYHLSKPNLVVVSRFITLLGMGQGVQDVLRRYMVNISIS